MSVSGLAETKNRVVVYVPITCRGPQQSVRAGRWERAAD